MIGATLDEPAVASAPDELLMVSWFKGGEVFRSGCTFTRGLGKIFYFRPGHESYPSRRRSRWSRAKPTGLRTP